MGVGTLWAETTVMFWTYKLRMPPWYVSREVEWTMKYIKPGLRAAWARDGNVAVSVYEQVKPWSWMALPKRRTREKEPRLALWGTWVSVAYGLSGPREGNQEGLSSPQKETGRRCSTRDQVSPACCSWKVTRQDRDGTGRCISLMTGSKEPSIHEPVGTF